MPTTISNRAYIIFCVSYIPCVCVVRLDLMYAASRAIFIAICSCLSFVSFVCRWCVDSLARLNRETKGWIWLALGHDLARANTTQHSFVIRNALRATVILVTFAVTFSVVRTFVSQCDDSEYFFSLSSFLPFSVQLGVGFSHSSPSADTPFRCVSRMQSTFWWFRRCTRFASRVEHWAWAHTTNKHTFEYIYRSSTFTEWMRDRGREMIAAALWLDGNCPNNRSGKRN